MPEKSWQDDQNLVGNKSALCPNRGAEHFYLCGQVDFAETTSIFLSMNLL